MIESKEHIPNYLDILLWENPDEREKRIDEKS